MTLRDILVSVVRTLVPVLAGNIITWLLKAHILFPQGLAFMLVDTVLIGAYYALIRFAEARWSWVGILLGWKAQPKYERQPSG